MVKRKTSQKRIKSKKISWKEYVPFSNPDFKDPELVLEALLECLKTGDLDSFRGVLLVHLVTVNKAELAKKAGIGRRTLYDLIDPKKKFNPGLSTISAIFQALKAA